MTELWKRRLLEGKAIGAGLAAVLVWGLFLASPPSSIRGESLSRRMGILIMAHGGTDEWNAAVEEAVVPLKEFSPVAVAFGMAERTTLQEAVRQLEREGVSRVAVVRLFISGQSFLHQTEYLLGLRADPPGAYLFHGCVRSGGNMSEGGDMRANVSRPPPPIESSSDIVISRHGMLDSPLSGEIVAERVRALSVMPERESVLILAHGAGEEVENDRWIRKMEDVANHVRGLGRFRDVRVETLREDWPDQRSVAEERIRRFVSRGNRYRGRVIVVPLRVYGFGPYEDVLDGLSFVSDGLGLLPHWKVTRWIRERAEECVIRAGWKSTSGSLSGR